MIDIYIDTE